MAPFDKDPKNSEVPPARDPGVSGLFDTPRKPQENAAPAPAGEFTKLFGGPPKPEPLEGIGAAKTPTPKPVPPVAQPAPPQAPAKAPVAPATASTATPSNFSMLFAATAPQKTEKPSGSWPGEFSAPHAASPGENSPTVVEPLTPTSRSAQPPVVHTAPIATPHPVPTPEVPVAAREKTVAPVPAAPVPPAAAEPAPAKSEFTMWFGHAGQQPAGEAVAPPYVKPALPAEPPQTPQKTPPGSFTQLFGLQVKVPEPPAPTPPPSAANRDAHPAKAASPEEFARMFDFPLRDSASANAPAAKPVAGEFTKMFSGSPATTPAPTPVPTAKDPGAFTKLFNSPSHAATETPKPQQADGFNKLFGPGTADHKPGSFTEVFGGGAAPAGGSANPGGYPPNQRTFPGAVPAAPVPPEKPQQADWFPAAAPRPTMGAPSSGATQIFKQPSAPVAPSAPPPPAGPSAFTQIISGGQARELVQEAALRHGNTPVPTPSAQPPVSFGAPSVTPPVVSAPYVSPPAMNMPGAGSVQPPYVQQPYVQPPQVQAPYVQPPYVQAPQMQMPQPTMGQPAASPAAPEKKVNWIPVIIGVNVLVLIVVILILIFALKK